MTPIALLRTIDLAIPLTLSLGFFLTLAHVYWSLPPRFAVHFNLRGEANGWMSPIAFATIAFITMLLVLGSTSTAILRLPESLFARLIPPSAILVATAGTGLAVGAFREILRVAIRKTGPPRPRWSTLFGWAVLGPALELAASSLNPHP